MARLRHIGANGLLSLLAKPSVKLAWLVECSCITQDTACDINSGVFCGFAGMTDDDSLLLRCGCKLAMAGMAYLITQPPHAQAAWHLDGLHLWVSPKAKSAQRGTEHGEAATQGCTIHRGTERTWTGKFGLHENVMTCVG